MTNVDVPRRGRAQTRARLLDAAEKLFVQRGTSISIDEVCKGAGFTRGAFYSNFRTVDDVLFAIYERRTDELLAAVNAAPLFDADQHESVTLEDIVSHVLVTVPADATWYALRASFAQHASADPAVAAALREHGEQMRIGLTPSMRDGVRAAGVEFVTAEEDAMRAIIAANVGAVLQGPLVDDPRALRRDTLLAVLTGLTRPAPSVDD